MKYLIPEMHGYVELVRRRTIHTPAGINKVILIYRYTCQHCEFTITQAGLRKIKRSADVHYTGLHAKTTSPELRKLMNNVRNQSSHPPQADMPDF